ncbi:MAG: rhodanese-like domain-containing protein [Chloroflexi bacterium]|nr:rhodanese-like domain-containing protein [Chloroflexota bacterium]
MFDWLKPKKQETPTTPPTNETAEPTVVEISALELRKLIESPAPPLVLDVREPYELEADGLIPDSVHIPMRFVPNRLADLPKDRPIVVYCAAGARSYNVAEFLLSQGYADVKNLRGGIIAWQASKPR